MHAYRTFSVTEMFANVRDYLYSVIPRLEHLFYITQNFSNLKKLGKTLCCNILTSNQMFTKHSVFTNENIKYFKNAMYW